MGKKALIIGAGLGGLTTALRLSRRGYDVEILEKNKTAGGRLNIMQKDGFKFDLGPTFFSMSYTFDEFIKDAEIEYPFQFQELDPLYAVNFDDSDKTYLIHKDIDKLAAQFPEEKNMEQKIRKYLENTGELFHDTFDLIVRRNFNSLWHYLTALVRVPIWHIPKLFRSFWQELNKYFKTDRIKEILSLASFFLGATPFNTPSVYTILSYTELIHDGYHNVKGGLYKIVEGLLREIEKKNIKIHYETEIISYKGDDNNLELLIDQKNKEWKADVIVINADAAFFRSKIFKRKKYAEKKLDKKQWTMAPLTIYLGIKGKIKNIHHHHYFLGSDFKDYAKAVYSSDFSLKKPYYYVNVISRNNPECAPEGCEALFILCPVPDLRIKHDWSDRDKIVDNLIKDLSEKTGFDIAKNIVSKTVMDPFSWQDAFDLYKGSGLGLGHKLTQMAALRPKNQDEKFKNVFYTGASTIPGTGLPMVVISSKLTVEQIDKHFDSK